MDIVWRHLNETLNRFADRFIQLARQNLDTNNSNASNTLYNTMEKIIDIGEDHFTVSISLEDYWKFVEEGTGPGHQPDARAQYWPKIEPLKEWVSIKPGVPKDTSFPYVVRWKIHEEGIDPKPFFHPAQEQAIREFETEIDEAIEADVLAFIQEKVGEMMETYLGKK